MDIGITTEEIFAYKMLDLVVELEPVTSVI